MVLGEADPVCLAVFAKLGAVIEIDGPDDGWILESSNQFITVIAERRMK